MATEDEPVIARFDTTDDANATKKTLEDAGYTAAELSLIGDPALCATFLDGIGNHAGRTALEGIGAGGAFGAVSGVVAGAGALAVTGPVGAITGAVGGGVIGALLGLGLHSDKAHRCEAAARSGSLVLLVHARPGDGDRVRSLLGAHLI